MVEVGGRREDEQSQIQIIVMLFYFNNYYFYNTQEKVSSICLMKASCRNGTNCPFLHKCKLMLLYTNICIISMQRLPLYYNYTDCKLIIFLSSTEGGWKKTRWKRLEKGNRRNNSTVDREMFAGKKFSPLAQVPKICLRRIIIVIN